ncbi:MAG: carboxy terminal-processing peptidase [Pseudomonadales bacterium]|nr:carboxy terminal-processing peptidase [Pseudomonadales bacterium]
MTTAMTYNRSSTRRLLAISLVALAFTGLLSPGSFATVSAISGLPGDSSHTAASIETLVPMPVHAETTRNITDALASRHYVSTTLDDALSTKIYAAYLEDLDPSKSYFLASDIAEFDSLRLQLDDALSRGDVTPAYKIFNRYHQRVIDRFEQVITMLEAGLDQFDFTINEALPLERKEEPWATTPEELDELWRKRVKNAVLNLKLSDKETDKIQDVLLKRYRNRLTRTLQTNSEDVFQLYMNSFTRTYDPHTQYFSPRTSENFNINMSLSLEGIGAVLQQEDEFTKVVSLVPAGPADKSRQIYPDDRIVAVGQGPDGEMVDVIGWRLDEVVQLIRGKKDTIVKLDVIPANAKDSTIKVVNIVRNTVKLEEQSAKSEIIEVEQFGRKHKIGIIDIPTFYVDFQALQEGNKDYKSTTRDVQELLVSLMAEGVEGVVIDLRDNGGGSLQEARTLTGLFIDRGPTVQVRNNGNRVDILNDRDIRTVYAGPLGVLVNRLSASASEIFAGAIQDYDRGVIIGNQTFGKGTVQTLLPLNQGQLKLTAAKFYRISGESTQHKGIVPDVDFPLDYDPESIGESTLASPLPWDKIQATSYRAKSNVSQLKTELINLHNARVKNDPEFAYFREASAYRQERSKQTSISLSEAARRQEKKDADAFWLGLENSKRQQQGLPAIASLDELNPERKPDLASNTGAPAGLPEVKSGDTDAADDQSNGQANDAGAGAADVASSLVNSSHEDAEDSRLPPPRATEAPDPHLVESGNILLDLISLEQRTAAENRPS